MPKQTKLPADTIILGFTGSLGSGSSFISKRLEDYGYKYFCLSDILKEIARENGEKNPSCQYYQDLGNDLRRRNKKGSFLVLELLRRIDKKIKSGEFDISKCKGIVIDSIRNDGEALTLRQFPYFYLFSIHADKETRRIRTLEDGKFATPDEFEKADERDRAENDPYGQHVKECNELADIIINNDQQFPKSAKKEIRKFIEWINTKFITLIENNKFGELTPEDFPSRDETLTTTAYAQSRLSSCLKRKVGAVIVAVKEATTPREVKLDKSLKEVFTILSSGYNEVPLGTTPCAFDVTVKEECTRDFIKEEKAKDILYCPNCGEKIKFSITCDNCGNKISHFTKKCPKCKKIIEKSSECPKCKIKIFDKYLDSGGKLLDMCRALHAEEQALINLAKIGSGSEPNLILYTTTFPCNLCANKIVAAGIKKIVYAEPYPMQEAVHILSEGGVSTEKFQGIKSSAYFRLYRF